MKEPIRLTQFSHGAGCGCKISPKVLDTIIQSNLSIFSDDRLLVGNQTKDDAAVYDVGGELAIISTTDFFMPIVDDPFDFGRVAATNAISDIYAMGGKPIMAIAILGWPVIQLGAETAAKVVEGGRSVCNDAGISLAGGHSIDSKEPIFGLAVTGTVKKSNLKTNSQATLGSQLYLTKPLGVGILTTAETRQILRSEHQHLALKTMCELNRFGAIASEIQGVTAITDVTGFGLAGHLIEVCEGSGLSADIDFSEIPKLNGIESYLAQGCYPGGTDRNFDSFGHKLSPINEFQKGVLCDPQTSGGLLIAVEPESEEQFLTEAQGAGVVAKRIGELVTTRKFNDQTVVKVN